MSIWDMYPATYRTQEIQIALKAVKAGSCVSIIGLSGSGKSNLMGFIAHRLSTGPTFFLVDCNDLIRSDQASFIALVGTSINNAVSSITTTLELSGLIKDHLKTNQNGICLLIDRFDSLNQNLDLLNNLRALRDKFKYQLTYIIASREAINPTSELAELFFANTIYLGGLTFEDSIWSIKQFTSRNGLYWELKILEKIYLLAEGYPSMLRAVCEAYASGISLELQFLYDFPGVKERIDEFWQSEPSKEVIRELELANHPLLSFNKRSQQLVPDLTVSEYRLMEHLQSHSGEICEKEDLILAVWPEEKISAGLRDDSLAQLIHRLREKTESLENKHIQTVPGRGYRYLP